jgi:hypothetical protein
MDRKRSDDGVARVVAWHNRHPLAHHIEPEQVVSQGHVELPFRSKPGQQRRDWRAVFREKFLPGHSVRQIARWALRHGQDMPPGADSGPLRQIELDTPMARDEGQAELLWLGTAAVTFGQRQSRVLLSSTDPRAVFGRRIWSRPRQAAVVFLLMLGVALPALRHAFPNGDDAPEPPPPVAMAKAPVEEALPASQLAQPEPLEPPAQPGPPEPSALPALPETPETPALPETPVSETSAVPETPAQPPNPPPTHLPTPVSPPFVDAEVRLGKIDLPSLKPQLGEVSRVAGRQASVASPPGPADPAAPTFALALRRVRTQAESELMGRALRSILARYGPMPGLRFDAMPAGDDWRAVCWPFATREEAERVREQLTARGQSIEVISF